MSRFEMEFEVLKDETGATNGFSLVSQPQTEAEIFCSTFPKALVGGKADIRFEGEEIVFDHLTEGKYAHKLSAEDTASLRELLSGKRQLKLERAGFLTPGFKMIPA